MPLEISERSGAIVFSVRVVPRASKSEIVGILGGDGDRSGGGVLKIRIASPPVDGAANAELVKLLARRLGVAKSAVEILSGQTSKTKQVKISGVSARDLEKILPPDAAAD